MFFCPVFERRGACASLENSAEIAGVVKAQHIGDLPDGYFGVGQKELRLTDTQGVLVVYG